MSSYAEWSSDYGDGACASGGDGLDHAAGPPKPSGRSAGPPHWLASLGYLELPWPECSPAILIGPAGILAVEVHAGAHIGPALARLTASAAQLERQAELSAGSVQPVLCLTSQRLAEARRLDGVDIVTAGRLRAWLMLRPVVLSAPQVRLLQVRLGRRAGSHPAGSAA